MSLETKATAHSFVFKPGCHESLISPLTSTKLKDKS